ncbi:MAG: DMT family transporter [Burkholderiaceae bacterium]
MKAADAGELLLLAALWGASFLFMRVGAPEFGAIGLAAVRVGLATLVLAPVLLWRDQWPLVRAHWRPIALVGILNSALPSVLYGHAALSISAGLASIFNASTPLFSAVIGWFWLRDRLTPARSVGLAIGFAGVVGLAWGSASVSPGSSGYAVVACLGATLCYGIAANYTKLALQGVPALPVATGSLGAATLALALPALWAWPERAPSPAAWSAVALLAVVCTAIAYLLFFRLLARIGPSNAIAVTFLIPAFALLWGGWLLDETITPAMVAGCAVILLGTGLATGLIAPRSAKVQPLG